MTRYISHSVPWPGSGRRRRVLPGFGLSLGFGDRFSLDVRYWDTDVSDKGGFCTGQHFQCDARFVVGAKVTY